MRSFLFTVMSIISYRKTLQSEVLDFLNKLTPPNQILLQAIIPPIVSQLLFYREEGRFLYPEVYLVDDIAALKVLPGFQMYRIAEGSADKDTACKAIKKCAPLCESRWSIYLMLSDDKIEYGLFTGEETVISVHKEDVLLSDDKDGLFIIGIRIMRDRLITVRSRGSRLDVCFDITDEEVEEDIEEKQLHFIRYTIEKQQKDGLDAEAQKYFLRRLLTHVYRHGHGTLACVVDGNIKIESVFKDGIILSSPIDFVSDFSSVSEQKNSILEGVFELMSGMLQSDGITVFSNDGRILAYNVFLKLRHEEDSDVKEIVGGARSRAFKALCLIDIVKSAYMQSQDGKIQVYERK